MGKKPTWGKFSRKLSKLRNAWILKGTKTTFTEGDAFKFTRMVCEMCTQNPEDFARPLFDEFTQFLEDYFPDRILRPCLQQKPDEELLSELFHLWEMFEEKSCVIRELFGYLDHCPIAGLSLVHASHTVFVNAVFDIDRMKLAVLNMFHNDREGKPIDRKLLVKVCDLLVGQTEDSVGNNFQASMLKETAEYYSSKAVIWIEQGLADYLKKAEKSLKWEESELYFPSHNKRTLLEIVQRELLVKHSVLLLEDEHYGCGALLNNNNKKDLLRMFRLYADHEEPLEYVAQIFKLHVTVEGSRLKQAQLSLSNKEISAGTVISLFDRYAEFVENCFQNSRFFGKALVDALEGVAGMSTERWLATFCHDILENCESDDLIKKGLEKVLKILAFNGDAHLFAKFYTEKLAKRLLLGKSVKEQLERMALVELKHVFGGPFTRKMEQMVMDLTLSRDVHQYLMNYFQIPDIKLAVNVLTKQSWSGFSPCDADLRFNMPPEMVKYQETFEEHFNSIKPHRKLSWIDSLGICTVQGLFDDKTIELIVTTYQASLLLLFNDTLELSFAEIVSKTKLEKNFVTNLLYSLCCEECQILNKVPKSKTISSSDSFAFNSKFTCKTRQLKVPFCCPKTQRVNCTRKNAAIIDGCLMGLMKRYGVLSCRDLIEKCTPYLTKVFQPEAKVLEDRISHLVTQQYLARDMVDSEEIRWSCCVKSIFGADDSWRWRGLVSLHAHIIFRVC